MTYIPVITIKGDYDWPELFVGGKRVGTGAFYAQGFGAQEFLDEVLAELLESALKARGVRFLDEEEEW